MLGLNLPSLPLKRQSPTAHAACKRVQKQSRQMASLLWVHTDTSYHVTLLWELHITPYHLLNKWIKESHFTNVTILYIHTSLPNTEIKAQSHINGLGGRSLLVLPESDLLCICKPGICLLTSWYLLAIALTIGQLHCCSSQQFPTS